MNKKVHTISPSTSLKSLPKYNGCLRKMYYKLFENVETNETDSTGANVGILTHELLMKYVNHFIYNNEWPKEFPFGYHLEKLTTNSYSKIHVSQEMHEKIMLYCKRATEMLKGMENFRVLFDPEMTLLYPYKASDGRFYMIKGKIDLVFSANFDGERHLCIADYKTGKMSYENKDGDPQFKLYTYLFEKLYGNHDHIPLPTKVIIFALQDNYIHTIDIDNEYTKSVDNTIEEYVKLVQLPVIDNFPKNPSGICMRHCEYSKVCRNIVMGKKL